MSRFLDIDRGRGAEISVDGGIATCALGRGANIESYRYRMHANSSGCAADVEVEGTGRSDIEAETRCRRAND
jgi:hypothetical protein